MRTDPKLTQLKLLTGATEEGLLLALLTLAGQKILERLYPYHPENMEVPDRYASKQVEIALYLYNKRGAEGQTAHVENGISRTYESADVPESLMRGVTPKVGVL